MKIKGKSTLAAEAKKESKSEITVKRLQYQPIGKGNPMRDMNKLTLADYFAAGGRSVAHYNSITLKKEVDLDKLDAEQLKSIAKAMVHKRIISKPAKETKEELLKAITG